MDLRKNKIIIILNIIVFCILFYVVYSFQRYFYLVYHDYLIPYILMGNVPDFGRIPASFLYKLTLIVLPDILKVHSQDFIAGIGAVIKSIFFMLICMIFSLSFFVNAKEKFRIFNIENLVVLPLSFFLLATPILLPYCHNRYFGRMEESVVFYEYFFCFLFYFAFFILFLYINKKEEKINIFMKSVIIVNSFFLGFWVELFNVSTLFSIIIFIILLYVYNRKLLKNRNLLLLIIPFIIGISCFYMFSGYSSGTKLLGYSYDWGDLFSNIQSYLYDFIKYYIKYMFVNNIWFYIFIFILAYLLWKRRNYNKKNIYLILITCISIITGYLIMNLFLIIYRETPLIGYSGFLLQREMYQILYLNVLEFVVVMLIGAFYFEYYKYKKKILFVLAAVIVLLLSVFIPNNNAIQKEKIETKKIVYDIEKRVMAFGIFGEITLLPVSYLKYEKVYNREVFMFDDNYQFETKAGYNIDKYAVLMKNRYFSDIYLLNRYYFEHEYGRDFAGVIFIDDKIADTELEKRLQLLNFKRETEKDILENDISFDSLEKYINYELTFNNIKELKVNKKNKDVILKATAYINYRDGKYKNALALYLRYIKEHPNDIDALINISDIYLRLKDIKKAEEILLKLHSLDTSNLSFLYELLKIYYYYYKDYKKALKICDKMISIQNNMYNLYWNKAIIYFAMNNKKEANKILSFIKEKDINKINYLLQYSGVSSVEELNNKKNGILVKPIFL